MRKKIVLVMLALLVLASMPLAQAAEGDQKVKATGELRSRVEDLNNYGDFDDDSGDRFNFAPYRARVNLAWMLADDVNVEFDVQNFGSWGNQDPFMGSIAGSDPRSQNSDGDLQSQTSIYQGYVALNKIGGSRFSAWVGRQEYNIATGMLLGNEPYYNGIAFDGIKGVFDWDKFDLTGFVFTTAERNDPASSLFQANPVCFDSFPGDPNATQTCQPGTGAEDERIFGLVGSLGFGDKAKSDLDIYLINHQELDSNFNTRAMILGANWRRMVKTKADAENSHWDYNAELAIENGEDEDPNGVTADFSGWMFDGAVGYNFVGDKTMHRVHLGYVSQAGDDDLTDNDSTGWSGLFPTVHGRFGKADFFGATFNAFDAAITATRVGYDGSAKDGKHRFGATYWMFAPTEDSVDFGAGPVDIEDYGTEIDLWYKYGYSANASLGIGIAQLMPDDGLTGGATFPDNPVTRVAAQLRVQFP